jgi:pyruvate/2-oxoglutarate dehydrogenase complex dihydrolipoamide dehydrogenase (E3) component
LKPEWQTTKGDGLPHLAPAEPTHRYWARSSVLIEYVTYDSIVIGSGQGGNPLAQQLAGRGEKVALIESGVLGGTCINTGCTPTKTMVASAQVAHYTRNAQRWGVDAGSVNVNLRAVVERKNEVVHEFRSGWERKVDQPGKPEWVRGRARFAGMRQLEVDGRRIEARRIFIDTGCRPAIPNIPGLRALPFLTNESMLDLTEIPQHLVVLGGGYVGLEFGQMFRRFGSDVTVIQSSAHILSNEDEDVTTELRRCLESEGIRFHVGARAIAARGTERSIEVDIALGDETQTVSGSHLLVATGRRPNTDDLALEKTGVRTNEKGYIVVNDRLETTAPDIWAIGDVTGGPAFTHISYNDYQIIYGNLFEGKDLRTSNRIVPYAVYTDPTLGRVGVTEKAARREGRRLKIGKVPMTYVARALERGETQGFMKIVVDGATDRVIGAAILSVEGGELVQILSTLMLANQPYTLLKGAIYIHPTLAEGFFGLMDSVKEANG